MCKFLILVADCNSTCRPADPLVKTETSSLSAHWSVSQSDETQRRNLRTKKKIFTVDELFP